MPDITNIEWAGLRAITVWGPVSTKGHPVLLIIPTRESRHPGTQGECKGESGFARYG